MLDKTGTLTSGRLVCTDVRPGDGVTTSDVFRLAAAAESGSEHPVARAIVGRARQLGLVGPAGHGGQETIEDFTNHAGRGVVATVEGRRVLVGRSQLLAQHQLTISPELAAAYASAQEAGQTVVMVGCDQRAIGVISVADTVKDTSAEAVRSLRSLGLTPVLLTGDNEVTAQAVARAVGIERVVADASPEGKVAEVVRLQRAGHRVAMVGDGVNDAAALARADLGIAVGTGTDAAIEASDLTLVRGDLRVVGDAIRLARATLRTIRANLFWAFAYNAAAIPLAAAGFLNPMRAGATMAASSVFVVTNSLRLRRFRPRR